MSTLRAILKLLGAMFAPIIIGILFYEALNAIFYVISKLLGY